MFKNKSKEYNLMLISKNISKMSRKFLCLIFIFIFCINSMAAIVSDNDGSAFTTKAEFEALKKNFADQIDNYNLSIDSKIDGAIAYYLAGINLQKKEDVKLMLWGGRKLGLIENEYSRPYVEGTTGGRMDFTLYAASGGNWTNGITAVADTQSDNANPTYFKTCFHRFEASSSPFKYLVVDVNKSDGNYFFNLMGYANVTETINALHRTHIEADKTQRMAWTVGLCGGYYSFRGALEKNASLYTDNFAQFCETTDRGELGAKYDRNTNFNDNHNEYKLTYQDITLASDPIIDNDFAYITNAAAGTVLNGVRTRGWHGANATNGTTESHSVGEIHMFGWNVVGGRGTLYNHHIDAVLASRNALFQDGAGVFNRIIQADSSYSSGSYGNYPSSYGHGKVSNTSAFCNLYKADIGGELTSNNIYSNELASAIKGSVKTGLIEKDFNGINQEVSPLYLGLPIIEAKEDDNIEIEFDLLDDAAEYDIAFTIGGFKNEPISQSQFSDAGCSIEGLDKKHTKKFPVTRTERKQKIKVNIEKKGILFMKYSASGGTSQQIKLPETCLATKY